MSNNESYPRLLAALDEVRRQWRLHKILEGVLLTVGGALVVLALLVAADNLFHPGAAGRYALACVLWGGLIGAVLSLIVRRVLEDRRDDFFAALVEQRHPQMRNTLINALQLGRDHTPGFSASLIEAIVKDADRGLVDTEVGESVDRKPTRNAALFALAGLLLVAGYAAAMTPRFFNGLARVLLPMSDIAPYTRTRLPAEAVEPGTTRIAEGKPLPITVRAQGDVAESPPASTVAPATAPGRSTRWTPAAGRRLPLQRQPGQRLVRVLRHRRRRDQPDVRRHGHPPAAGGEARRRLHLPGLHRPAAEPRRGRRRRDQRHRRHDGPPRADRVEGSSVPAELETTTETDRVRPRGRPVRRHVRPVDAEGQADAPTSRASACSSRRRATRSCSRTPRATRTTRRRGAAPVAVDPPAARRPAGSRPASGRRPPQRQSRQGAEARHRRDRRLRRQAHARRLHRVARHRRDREGPRSWYDSSTRRRARAGPSRLRVEARLVRPEGRRHGRLLGRGDRRQRHHRAGRQAVEACSASRWSTRSTWSPSSTRASRTTSRNCATSSPCSGPTAPRRPAASPSPTWRSARSRSATARATWRGPSRATACRSPR